ncbi:hypothetical protein KEM48_003063 [Puccinia striiformis f. sp. tritici PST-130]|nr:hypothetical protein KEM48_003063 [Puccinia striiformis f. sp. tritici PST-130]
MLGCPCPAIATMINHSYLKVEDSKQKIPIHKLMIAMVECYNLSWTFAVVFAIVGNLRLRKIFGFSIEELGTHGKIEHDASMTRFDVKLHYRLEEWYSHITGFAREKVLLESRIKNYEFQSKTEVNFLGRGESCLALLAHRHVGTGSDSYKAGNRKPSVEIAANAHWLRTWFSEERLPVELGWKKPSSKITLFGTLRLMKEMKALQDG